MWIWIYITTTNRLLGQEFRAGHWVTLEPSDARRMVEAGYGEVAKLREDGQVDWHAYLPPRTPQ